MDTEDRLVVARGREWGVNKMGRAGQKVPISNYNANKSWGCNVQHGDYS